MDFNLKEYHRNVSDEDLLKDIIRVASDVGKESLSTKEYKENGGRYSYSTIQHRFGTWTNAIQLCNLKSKKPISRRRYNYVTNEELITDLKTVADKIGVSSLTSSEYEKHGRYNYNSFIRQFGSWNNALLAAGLEETGYHHKISLQELLFDIETLWIKLGRQPTCSDIKKGLSRYGLKTYYNHFGSWRKALEFFVAYMNREQEVRKDDDNKDAQLPIEIKQRIESAEQIHKTKRDINLRMRFLVMKRDNFKCCMCGRSPALTPGLELHIDHIKPWAKGGETTIDNLQTLCSDCNIGKSDIEL